MQAIVEITHQFIHELRSAENVAGVALASEDVTPRLGELVDEAFTNAVLADRIAHELDELRVRITPQFEDEPLVKSIRIDLIANGDGKSVYSQSYRRGPWTREAAHKAAQLREEGSLGENELPVQMLVALPRGGVDVPLPPLQAPAISETTLEACGARKLGAGEFVPDRPVLINKRFEEESVIRCEEADVVEAGGAAFGQIVRLAEPLPGAETRVVTILSGMLFDARQIGEQTQFHFKPEALADAQQMCELRGFGERVLTVFHTHGWSNKCCNCNQNSGCMIAEAKPSLQDYHLLATLFPGKSTLMPIAGRKLGAEGRRPLLQVYAWRKGEMRPIRWKQYED